MAVLTFFDVIVYTPPYAFDTGFSHSIIKECVFKITPLNF